MKKRNDPCILPGISCYIILLAPAYLKHLKHTSHSGLKPTNMAVNPKIPKSYPLKNAPGFHIPSVGFGTFDPALFVNPSSSKDPVRIATLEALEAGYRHIDTAFSYGSEKQVGMAIQEWISAGKGKGEELWVTSKLYNTFHRPDDVIVGMELSLRDLGLEYGEDSLDSSQIVANIWIVDLYLMHCIARNVLQEM